MSLQWVGTLLAAVTFGTIAAGHVLVRRLHARYGTRPALPLFILGGLVLTASLLARDNMLSAVLGVSGITVVWDGIEMYRQERRSKK
jgi:hypothetical protein